MSEALERPISAYKCRPRFNVECRLAALRENSTAWIGLQLRRTVQSDSPTSPARFDAPMERALSRGEMRAFSRAAIFA